MDIHFLVRAAFAVLSCLVIVRHGLKKKSLDLTGAVASVVVGFILTLSNLCFFASCVTFFLTSSKLTRFKSDVKEKIEDDFKKGLCIGSFVQEIEGVNVVNLCTLFERHEQENYPKFFTYLFEKR